MAKERKPKVKPSGQHVRPRRAVQLPRDWMDVAEELARGKPGERPMTLVWWLVDVIRQQAVAAGKTDLPPLPWDKAPEE